MSINSVNISGNLTRDAELRRANNGTAIASMSVAVNDRAKNPQTGEWEDRPNFVDVTLFGTRAEKLAQYLVKGTKVTINGRLRYNTWEKDGQKRSKLDVICENLEFMSRSDNAAAAKPAAPSPAAAPVYEPADDSYDDDLPF